MDPNAIPQPPGEVILVDKPLTWTSFDVVKKLKYALKVKKIGHAGTLDPLATGLLILCTGKMTKQIEKFQSQEKEYTGTFTIGATTPSYDLETEVINHKPYEHITSINIEKATTSLTGEIKQTPPIYSAVRVDGQRAYKSARKGETPKVKERTVLVHEFEITQIDLPQIKFRIKCSKGTYIRTMAYDFGKLLGVGAYLSELRRTRIGNFTVNDAKTIDQLVDL